MNAQMIGADLSDADLSGTTLYGANLGKANLSGADLTATHLGEPGQVITSAAVEITLRPTQFKEAKFDDKTRLPFGVEESGRWGLVPVQGKGTKEHPLPKIEPIRPGDLDSSR
jgi:uncharacterized protein YjbI with pentapeptide repeats